MDTKPLISKWLTVGIILLFIGGCVVLAIAQDTRDTPFVSMTKTMPPASSSSRGETELKYYMEWGLSTTVGVTAGAIWKTAI